MADETPDTEQTEPEAPAAPKLSAAEERARREHAARLEPALAHARAAPRRPPRGAREEGRRAPSPPRAGEDQARDGGDTRTGTPPAEPKVTSPQHRTGTVVSAKPDKTIVVRIDLARRHRKYEKIVRSTSRLHVHDETNDANEGDLVRVVESRPLSRTKRWRLEEVLERAK